MLLQQAVINAFDESELQNYSLPTAASILQSALPTGLTTIILGIFAALFVCEDYTDGTLKNIYSKGYGRNLIYVSKFITVLIFSLAACVVSWLCSFIFGSLYFETGTR